MDGFITELVDRLIATTLHTVVFGLVVWAISYRSFRLPPHVQCWLWWLVSLQALIGLAAGPIELPWLPAAATSDSLAVSSINEIVDTSSNTAGIEAWRLIAFSVWSLFVLVTAWITFREWLQGRTILQRAVPHEGVKALSQLVMLAQRKGLRRLPRMLVSSECTSPLLAGNFRPVLLMPARCTLSDVDLEMAISHELAHLRRNDLAWGLIPCLARLLFFFHPIARMAVTEYDIAREAACDAEVLDTKQVSHRAYGNLLVRLGTAMSSAPGVGVRSATFHALKRRLTLLQGGQFLSPSAAAALLFVAALGVLPVRLVAAQFADTSMLLPESVRDPADSVRVLSEGRSAAPDQATNAPEVALRVEGFDAETRATVAVGELPVHIDEFEMRHAMERLNAADVSVYSGVPDKDSVISTLLHTLAVRTATLDLEVISRETIARQEQISASLRQASIERWRHLVAAQSRVDMKVELADGADSESDGPRH